VVIKGASLLNKVMKYIDFRNKKQEARKSNKGRVKMIDSMTEKFFASMGIIMIEAMEIIPIDSMRLKMIDPIRHLMYCLHVHSNTLKILTPLASGNNPATVVRRQV
jgi:hypothetical protein